ncbi:hypothetical protein [Carboxylicivirga marina]|uniref:hypothetical protein n=1 Tax=Carboxylicivirga marina TaxID=2800988 RepID=UPI0025932AF9|nr:hypothetical protein [uncultured Carboxylicivirga sp.]
MRIQIKTKNYLASMVLMLLSIVVTGQNRDSLRITSLVNESWISLQNTEYEKSRDIAEQILKIDEDYCFGYILLGTVYAKYANDCSSKNNVEKGIIYCLAIDMFEKAKNANPTCAETANENIQIYSNYLVDKESVFIHIKEGEEVNIDDWIKRKTKFRYKD